VLGAPRHGFVGGPDGGHGAPDAASEDDRPTGSAPDPELAHQLGDDAADLLEVLDSNGPWIDEHPSDDPPAVERAAVADRHGRRRAVRPCGRDDRPLGGVRAEQGDPLRAQQHPDLPGQAAKTAEGGDWRATSVATRRSAACSRTSSSSASLVIGSLMTRVIRPTAVATGRASRPAYDAPPLTRS